MNFKTGFIALALMGLASVVAVGCGGSVCDDAAEVCGTADAEDSGAECTGQVECAANCIVDNDSCDISNEALVTCLTDCAGA
jgi:hypothetical protein